MDTDRFDGFTRFLATTDSRRRILAALAGGLFAAWGGRGAGVAARNDMDKVSLCHRTSSDTNAIVVIEVDADAVADHLAHGDFRYRDCCRDGDCAGGQVCVDGACQATCRALGATCNPDDECCQIAGAEIRCDVAGCGGTHCCRPDAGHCSNDCDCCGSLCCDINHICDNDCGFD